jgi:hypothetical protein
MKIQNFQKFLAVTAVASLCLLASNVLAQDSSTSTTAATTTPAAAQPAAASQATPQLSYAVSEVVQLARANVGEDVIVNYIQNSGNAYGLDANQILYLKQQGVSDRVINTMLKQPKLAVAAQPVTSSASASTAATSTATVAPTVTYVQTVPTTYYYYQPYYFPAYAWYPPVTFSFGWGWGRGWGGWHGGWHR